MAIFAWRYKIPAFYCLYSLEAQVPRDRVRRHGAGEHVQVPKSVKLSSLLEKEVEGCLPQCTTMPHSTGALKTDSLCFCEANGVGCKGWMEFSKEVMLHLGFAASTPGTLTLF